MILFSLHVLIGRDGMTAAEENPAKPTVTTIAVAGVRTCFYAIFSKGRTTAHLSWSTHLSGSFPLGQECISKTLRKSSGNALSGLAKLPSEAAKQSNSPHAHSFSQPAIHRGERTANIALGVEHTFSKWSFVLEASFGTEISQEVRQGVLAWL